MIYLLAFLTFLKNADQKGYDLLNEGKANLALEHFEDVKWKAAAAYKAQKYDEAICYYQQLEDTYNLGNAYALKGDTKRAIECYKRVLESDPDHEDATYNLRVLEELPPQEPEKQNKDDSGEQEQQDKDGSEEQQDKGEQGEDKPQDKSEQEETDQEEQESQADPSQAAESEYNEDKQADEQWLKGIPDDPGHFLKQKFRRDYMKRHAKK